MEASRGGSVECVQMLLDRGAMINEQDNVSVMNEHVHVCSTPVYVPVVQEGRTPLMEASHGGSVECVKMLLDRGAKVNEQDKVSVIQPGRGKRSIDCKKDAYVCACMWMFMYLNVCDLLCGTYSLDVMQKCCLACCIFLAVKKINCTNM